MTRIKESICEDTRTNLDIGVASWTRLGVFLDPLLEISFVQAKHVRVLLAGHIRMPFAVALFAVREVALFVRADLHMRARARTHTHTHTHTHNSSSTRSIVKQTIHPPLAQDRPCSRSVTYHHRLIMVSRKHHVSTVWLGTPAGGHAEATTK